MAESLRESLVKIFAEAFYKPITTIKTPSEYADSIISLMLAKVDKALLDDRHITDLVNGYNSVSHSPCGISVYKYIAKAQLQAFKDILEGK